MTREVFPLAPDREVITAFLEGKGMPKVEDNVLTIKNKILTLAGYMIPIMHYGSDGSLMGGLNSHTFDALYGARAINCAMELLGDAARLVKERCVSTSPVTVTAGGQWFFGDQPITLGVNFVMAGPMGIMAWRASRGIKPKRIR